MGIFWNIILPIIQILIYTVVFSQLVGLRSPAMTSQNRYAFVLYICSGILPWLTFSGSVISGSNAFLVNARYLRKLPIPEEIFVAQSSVADVLGLIIQLILLVIVGLLVGHLPAWTYILLPVVAVLFVSLAFGIGLLLATLRIFFRDIGHILGVMMQMWMWTLPVIYFETILPPKWQSLLKWNPPYAYIKAFRLLFLENQLPSWEIWVGMLAWTIVFILLGYFVLQKLRPELRDLL